MLCAGQIGIDDGSPCQDMLRIKRLIGQPLPKLAQPGDQRLLLTLFSLGLATAPALPSWLLIERPALRAHKTICAAVSPKTLLRVKTVGYLPELSMSRVRTPLMIETIPNISSSEQTSK